MKTVNQIVYNAFQITDNFNDWKKELRQHDITNQVVNLLDGVPQGTYYHPEFDVLVHTYYVCRAVMLQGKKVSRKLLEAAFLHDVGKATTTNIGDKRIYHFGHPDASVEYIDKIKDRLANWQFTRDITAKHMNAKHSDEFHSFFNQCDKVISKDLFLSETNNYTIWKNKIKEWWVHFKQRHANNLLIVPIGISGSGKSTYLKKNYPSFIIVSPDDIRRELSGNVSDQNLNKEVWELTFKRLRSVLDRHGRAVLDATNTVKFLRVQSMAKFNDCQKIALVFNCGVATAVGRVNKDIENKVDRSAVPENIIKRQDKNLRRGLKSLKYEFNKVVYL